MGSPLSFGNGFIGAAVRKSLSPFYRPRQFACSGQAVGGPERDVENSIAIWEFEGESMLSSEQRSNSEDRYLHSPMSRDGWGWQGSSHSVASHSPTWIQHYTMTPPAVKATDALRPARLRSSYATTDSSSMTEQDILLFFFGHMLASSIRYYTLWGPRCSRPLSPET